MACSLLSWILFTAFQLYAFAEWRDDTVAEIAVGFSSLAVAAALIGYWLRTEPLLAGLAWLNIALAVALLFYAVRNVGLAAAGALEGRRARKAREKAREGG